MEDELEKSGEDHGRLRQLWREDPARFAKDLFPGLCRLNWSRLHRYIFSRRKEKTSEPPPGRRGVSDVILAPRGAAKSTLISLILPIHALLHRLDFYIVLISATQRQATLRLENIRRALLENDRLREHYAEEISGCSKKSERSIIVNGTRVDAFSAGSEIRGITFDGWRPTWIILDDVESNARVYSSDYRDALSEWMGEVIENLGNGYTNIDVIGTLLHSDALPARLAARPDFRFEKFASILAEAENGALWDQWRAILFDLSDPGRAARARRFFEENREAMLRGAEVLWPEKEDYYSLQLIRATRGPATFNKEKQNEPPREGESLLIPGEIQKFDAEGRSLIIEPQEGGYPRPRACLDEMRIFGFLDPALGKANGESRRSGGDFAAIVTVGLMPDGYLFVLGAWLERTSPSLQVDMIFRLHERWNYESFGFEANAFQELLLGEINAEKEKRRKSGKRWMLDIQPINHRLPKTVRVAGLEPRIRNRWILFNRELPEEFMRQLRDFPAAPHDDGPDALEGAVRLANEPKESFAPQAISRKRARGASNVF
ncbi:hypothetical protein HYR69_10970 [Candidatus Sumerlaeota bacterium]|nr:hypothetical protein [Candidatus Sumerlaeota bacterium]MBI3735928.1 hypothetical protein [Candidatus Sumerlaeota bacterium]